jgi:hypothetical protein
MEACEQGAVGPSLDECHTGRILYKKLLTKKSSPWMASFLPQFGPVSAYPGVLDLGPGSPEGHFLHREKSIDDFRKV